MISTSASRRFSFSPVQLFKLVADIERYPEFVPAYRNARIIRRDADRLLVEQELGMGPIQHRFTTEANLDCPHRLTVSSRDALFKMLNIEWHFTPEERACQVRLSIQAELSTLPLQLLAKPLLFLSAERQLDLFMARARQLYPAGFSPEAECSD